MSKVNKNPEESNKDKSKSKKQLHDELSNAIKKVAQNDVNGYKRFFRVPDSEGLELLVVPRAKIPKLLTEKGHFVRVFQTDVKELMSSGQLSEGGCKLFLFLISILEFDNWIPMNKAEISRQLDWGKNGRKIAKFMNELLDKKVIERAKRKHHSVYSYRLKIEVAYKMSRDEWNREKEAKNKEYDTSINSKIKRNPPTLDDF